MVGWAELSSGQFWYICKCHHMAVYVPLLDLAFGSPRRGVGLGWGLVVDVVVVFLCVLQR